jgi:hypothetical protein
MKRQEFLREELKLFPTKKIVWSLALLFISCALIFFRGSKEYDSLLGIEYCSVSYWMLNASQIGVAFFFEYLLFKYLKNRQIQIEENDLTKVRL